MRPWLRLVLALATIFVAGIVSSGAASGATVSAIIQDVATTCSDHAAPARSIHLRERRSRPSSCLSAVDPEIDDDDDDTVGHGAHHAPPASRSVPAPSEPDHTTRAERGVDTSRFAAGIGHPRGPPAV